MTTVAELLEKRKAGGRSTVADAIASRDRAWETRSMVPPLEENPETYYSPPPVGYETRNPIEPQISEGNDVLRQLQIGTQGAGRGLAGLAGLPVDLTELGLNLGAALTEGGLGLAGTDVDLPRLSGSVGGSQSIADAFGGAVEGAVGEEFLIDRADMTPNERMRYSINQFGAEGAAGGGLLSRLRGLLPRSLTAPYEAAGSNARVLMGDTAAGMGSGAAMEAYDQFAPEPIQDSLIGEMIAGILGGIGGATLPNVGDAAATAARGAAGNRTVPESVIPRDPDTMLPVQQKDVSRAAALYQEQAMDPQAASAQIADYLRSIEGGANPSSALIADDPGLLTAERRMRAQDPAPFIQQDRAAMNSVSDDVASVRPEGASPDVARAEAGRVRDETLAASRSAVTGATENLSEMDRLLEDLGSAMLDNRGRDQASRDLDRVLVDDTYLPARGEKNRLYDEAAASDATVGQGNVQAAAQGVQNRSGQVTPALRDSQSETLAGAFADASEPRPLAGAMEDRRRLSEIEGEARRTGDFGRADTARDLKRAVVNADISDAAQSGAPGTEALAAADTNYREKFAPYFRDGNASPDFFKGIDRDPSRGSTPPEATAERFLTAGPTSRAAAEDVAQIISISPNPDEGLAAVREYVKADAVGKGVVKDGVINENALARYMSQREGMFDRSRVFERSSRGC